MRAWGGCWTACIGGCRGEQERESFSGDEKFTQVHAFPPLSHTLQAVNVDDRTGPLWLCGLVVVALSAVLILSSIDFYEVYEASKSGGNTP